MLSIRYYAIFLSALDHSWQHVVGLLLPRTADVRPLRGDLALGHAIQPAY